MYKQINQKERIEIYRYIGMGYDAREIGKKMGKHRTTISRHIGRNSKGGEYDPMYAEKLYKEGRTRNGYKRRKLVNDIDLRRKVIGYFKDKEVDRSPDIIAEDIKKKDGKKRVSMKTIYNHIREIEPGLGRYLRYRGRGYKRRKGVERNNHMNHIPSIELRDKEIETRRELGHREVDCIVGKEHTPGLITMVERKSRYLVIQKKHTFKASPVSQLITYALYGKCVHSITSDNGSEFQYLNRVGEKLGCRVYRCHPYSSWEKGSNERNNREIRVYIPKGSDIREYTEEEIRQIQNKINRKPRKILGYKSAEQVFFGKDY